MRRIVTAAAVLGILASAGYADAARSLVSRGNRAYARGQFDQALQAYQQAARARPEAAEIWFNIGNAHYRLGDYRAAMDAYEQAAVRSRAKGLEARSKFNQGNACLRQALLESAADLGRAVEGLQAGIRLYQDALKLDPELNDARHNIEVARRLSKQLEERRRTEAGRSGAPEGPAKLEPANERTGSDRLRPPSLPAVPPRFSRPEPRWLEQPSDPLREILEQEREYRRRRRLENSGGVQPVEKDW